MVRFPFSRGRWADRAGPLARGLAASCAVLWGCSGGDAPEATASARRCTPLEGAAARPNLVLVVLCTFRYDHMSGAGYPRPTTPFLDSLAARGLAFENAWSASSWTKPAAASLLTGLTPNVHGLVDFHDPRQVERGRVPVRRILADEVLTLAECLRDSGYRTAGRSNNIHVSRFFNLQQGFEDFVADRHMTASGMVNQLEGWLRARDATGASGGADPRPFFYLLLARDAHITYRPHYEYYRAFNRVDPPVTREAYDAYARDVWRQVKETVAAGGRVRRQLRTRFIDLYDAELRQLDDALRRLPGVLHAAGVAERTLLAVTADHGERFFERGDVGHGSHLDARTLHTPLLLAGPGIPAGERRAELVRSIDVFPTLAARAGARPPERLPGRDLLAAPGTGTRNASGGDAGAATAADADPRPFPGAAGSAFASFEGVEHMVRSGRYAYYQRPDAGVELYDLEADPGERRDLAAGEPARVRWLGGELSRWRDFERTAAGARVESPTRALPEEVADELRELGYLE